MPDPVIITDPRFGLVSPAKSHLLWSLKGGDWSAIATGTYAELQRLQKRMGGRILPRGRHPADLEGER